MNLYFSAGLTDLVFIENDLYRLLKQEIEGQIILGFYKNYKILLERRLKTFIILLERRLKTFIIQRVIVENPITYK